MCTCASLIYRYYVPVTLVLFFIYFDLSFFLSLNPFAFCKERKNKQIACIFWLFWLLSLVSPPVLPLMERQLHILLSIIWGLCFLSANSPWPVQRCGEASSRHSVNRGQEGQALLTLSWRTQRGPKGAKGGQRDCCRARDCRSAVCLCAVRLLF